MNPGIVVAVALAALAVGGGLGYLLREMFQSRKLQAAQKDAGKIVLDARNEAIKLKETAEAEISAREREVAAELRDRRAELQRQERRAVQKEENLDRKIEQTERREQGLVNREKAIDDRLAEVEAVKAQQRSKLEAVSGLTVEQAKVQMLALIETEVRNEANRLVRRIETQTREEADERAREIITSAIERLGGDVSSETTTSAVPLPNDEMKGRLIGREGRNIRALEAATGVDLVIDDTPGAISISCFDPVRREVARIALTRLIQDGRIQPARIEEEVKRAEKEVENTIKQAGEQAVYELGVQGLPAELVKLIGRLKYRTSYGQNILQHSVQAAQLAALMAAEIGADVKVCKLGALLHDVGKALTHEVEGAHHVIGADLMLRFGLPKAVAQAVIGHHEDGHLEGLERVESAETWIVAAADAITGARPGARRESLESYLKRLEAVEGVANSFEGVEKSYAIQAGREVRIMVKPERIDDLGIVRLARDIGKKIEESLQYPGQIKVTVIRETRAVDFAK
ncbi:MAG: ribonuclease Y [Dehalococcoidia bacterium]|nr:ribonuclease Y [Dehalococcoidia bacterium]